MLEVIDDSLGFKIFKTSSPLLTSRCLVIESSEAREILTNHLLTGYPLINLTTKAVERCIKAFFAINSNAPRKSQQFAEVIPLSGSLTYNMIEAFHTVFNKPLRRNFIGIRRFQKPNGNWDTLVSYANFEALDGLETKLVFIGDTIATGVTIRKVIQLILAHIQSPVIFVIISIAGSLIGAQRLVDLENSIQHQFPASEIWCLFTEAFFGLEDNGTDMPVLHPDTLATEELISLSKKRLGNNLSRYLCSVLDWGKRTNSPIRHYTELARELDELDSQLTEDKFFLDLRKRCQRKIDFFDSE